MQAVVATGLDGALSDTSTTYTVFAPNDRALLRLVTDLTGTRPRLVLRAINIPASNGVIHTIDRVLVPAS